MLGHIKSLALGPVPSFERRSGGNIGMLVTRHRNNANERDAGSLWQLHLFSGQS
jgi:hypothetical protein